MASDARIEIAEKMRGPFDVCECVGHTYINGTLFGMQVCAKDEQSLRDGMQHLANLIDPTCRMTDSEWDNGERTWGCICSACDAHIEHTHSFSLDYCPHCGARVTERVMDLRRKTEL